MGNPAGHGDGELRSRERFTRKKALSEERAFLKNIAGDHLISHTVARAVPSAQRGLTSVFGMGTGDPSRYGHRQIEAF